MVDSVNTDTLVKPDMRAVLSRTHLPRDLHGFLLPVFEAISNAMDSIYERFGDDSKSKGKIQIDLQSPNDPAKIIISVTDNGVGLHDDNYKSFKTPFSGHKLSQKGRGFGRFIAFKVFARILYSSRYAFFAEQNIRAFRFDILEKNEFIFFDAEPDFAGVGMRVEYNQPLGDWHELIRALKAGEVLEEIGSHFLPYFLYRWLPEISIKFGDGPPQNITQHFGKIFVQYDSGTLDCEREGVKEKLSYSLTKIPKSRLFKSHCLLLSAADRIVGFPRDLTNKIGEAYFTDDKDEKYIVIAVVRGEAFERRLNDARTSINLPPKVIEEIVSSVSEAIQGKESAQIEKIKSAQSESLGEALRENPILRLGLRGKTVGEYIAGKPNNWRAEQFVSDLAIERYRATNDLHKEMAEAASDSEGYERHIKDLVSKLDEGKKEALAEYVIHRKNIIALVEIARKRKDDGSRSPEDVIHDLVFRRFPR